MKKINLLIIFLIVFSCAGYKKKGSQTINFKKKYGVHIYKQYWNISKDSLNLFLHMELPLNQFVFLKDSNFFYSDLIFTLVISDIEKNIQVDRKSWHEKITQPFHDDTRNPDNYFITERNILLSPGKYKLFLNVQDKWSRTNWRLDEEYELKYVQHIGPILPFANNEKMQKIISMDISQKIDTLWLKSQVYLHDTIPDQVDYEIKKRDLQIRSGKINVSGKGENYLYLLPIPLEKSMRGLYEIKLSFKGVEQFTYFNYGSNEKNYWTDDLEELVGVMQYILSAHSEYKELKNMDKDSQWNYIDEYWKEKDPSLGTEQNELLLQLNKRVKFVNKNFSILMPGWRSDRGRIYITYGPPQYIDESRQNQLGYTYQKWIYPNGRQFTFIDRTMSGDYSLISNLN